MSNWPQRILISSSFVFSSLLATGAYAQSVTGSIDVSINLAAACEINDSTATSGVDFGTLDFGGNTTLFEQADAAVLNSGTAVSVLCTPGVSPTVQITNGLNDANSGASANHALVNGSQYIPYSIFTDTARSNLLTINTPHALSGTADGTTPQVLELYGRAFGQPGLQAGTYTDTLNVELLF